MGKIIGIDLGTTNSALSVIEGDTYKVIENNDGGRTTPSIIAFKAANEKKGTPNTWLVGNSAQNQAATNAQNTLYDMKRLIGRRFDDPEVQKLAKVAPYKIVESEKGDAWVEVNGEAMSPIKISAKVLEYLKESAERYLGEKVTEAVITVPAYFNDAQRQATKDAGRIAGLDVKRIINEPTAAALAYGMDKKKDGKIIVYDLGGGTFDVSVLEVSYDEEDGSFIQVQSTNGDTFLGGRDFDDAIMNHLIEKFQEEDDNDGIDLTKDPSAMQRLKEAAEQAKIDLSSSLEVEVNVPFISMGASGPVHLNVSITRNEFEGLVADLVERTLTPCKNALSDAGLKPDDIDEVIMVGGMTRMPKIIETVKDFFGKEPRRDVNPDEIVAAGASLQGGALNGELKSDVLLEDVTPLTLGVRAAGDTMSKMIERNTKVPAKVSKVFTTGEDDQDNVEVIVYQGEREVASANKLLGTFVLDDIPPAKAGVPKIEVTFELDTDGVLKVSAKDQATGREQKIKVEANGGLSEDEINKMIEDGQAHAEEDKKFAELSEQRHMADKELKKTEKDAEKEWFTGAPEDVRKAFEKAKQELTEAVKKDDPALIGEKREAMKEKLRDVSSAFTEKAQKEQQKTADSSNDNKDTAPQAEAETKSKPAQKGPEA